MSDDSASRGGSALTEGLGPLPPPGKVLREPPAFYKDEWREHHFYTADQMRAYAAAAGQWATAIACFGACAGWYVAADEERKNSTKV